MIAWLTQLVRGAALIVQHVRPKPGPRVPPLPPAPPRKPRAPAKSEPPPKAPSG